MSQLLLHHCHHWYISHHRGDRNVVINDQVGRCVLPEEILEMTHAGYTTSAWVMDNLKWSSSPQTSREMHYLHIGYHFKSASNVP